MKISRACPGMLSSENDGLKFLKTEKNIKCPCIMYTEAEYNLLLISLRINRPIIFQNHKSM